MSGCLTSGLDKCRTLHSIPHVVAFTTCLASLIRPAQIDSDDVITRDEQIYVLIGAHAKCERSIKAHMSLVKGLCAAFKKVVTLSKGHSVCRSLKEICKKNDS